MSFQNSKKTKAKSKSLLPSLFRDDTTISRIPLGWLSISLVISNNTSSIARYTYSPIDTKTGGRYDGILGVQAALEVLRTLHENNIQTYSPVALIDWTNEEGARFPGAMMSSGVWSTKSSTPLSACHSLLDSTSISMKTALQEIGYLGDVPCDHHSNPLSAYFELHIEQGPHLESAQKKVGIVTGVNAMKWFSIRVSGEEGHAGTVPMSKRADALVTTSRLITAVYDVALESGLGVATVGVINNDTQSQATIPSGVEFIIDVRCSTDAMVETLCGQLFDAFDGIVKGGDGNGHGRTSYEILRTWGLPESVFHGECIGAVREVAVAEVGEEKVMEMKSGPGHDAAWTSKVVNTSMIFVPSRDGISHNPAEYTSPEDCALGAQVLLGAVMTYDDAMRKGSI